MNKFDIQEPDLDEIMRKIREEVAARKSLSHGEEPLCGSEFSQQKGSAQKDRNGVFSNFLWTFGTSNSALIKKIPLVKNVAEKYYWLLANKQGDSDPGGFGTKDMRQDLEDVLNYHKFLEETGRQGLKGRIKLFIFKLIGFFAWWQEQINSALYREIVNQRTGIDGAYQELVSQRAKIEEVSSRLATLSRAEDALYQELIDQRTALSGSDKAMEKSLTWKIDRMTLEIHEQIRNLELKIMELEKRLISLGEGKSGSGNQ